jgi:uncharacterized phage infection (PIP) family protein YhgE
MDFYQADDSPGATSGGIIGVNGDFFSLPNDMSKLVDKLVDLIGVNKSDTNDLRDQITECCSNLPGILNSISDLQGQIADEVQARLGADTAEATARADADSAESTARETGDSNLDTKVDGVSDDVSSLSDKLTALSNEYDMNRRLAILRGYL